MHVTLIGSELFKAESQGKHFVESRGAGGREGITFYLKLISALSFSQLLAWIIMRSLLWL